MKVFVHIGTHKTGSKSIQAFLRKEVMRFGSHGLIIPKSGTIQHHLSGHHNLVWELFGDRRFDPSRGTIADMLAEIGQSGAQKAILSSENFEYLVDHPALLEQFEQTLVEAGHEVNYVLILRRVDDYALSLYAQLRAKSGLGAPFKEFIQSILRDGKFVMRTYWVFYFDYAAFIGKWRSVSQGSLDIIDYNVATEGVGLLPTFLTAIGAPKEMMVTAAEAEVRNTRRPSDITSAEKVIAGRLLRRRFPKKGL